MGSFKVVHALSTFSIVIIVERGNSPSLGAHFQGSVLAGRSLHVPRTTNYSHHQILDRLPHTIICKHRNHVPLIETTCV